MATKSTKVKTPVSAKTIRTAFTSGALDPAKVTDAKGNAVSTACLFGKNGDGKVRGRLNPAFVQAYLKAHPTHSYAEKSGAESKTIEVPLFSAKTGKPVKPVTLPIAEVRRLSGTVGQKGRIPQAALVAAGKAYQSGK